MNVQKMKKILKRVWHFIWKDDSLLSWIVNIILAFILVKFIIYPLIGFFLGTGFPIVAVVSGSMEHNNLNFDGWWETHKEWYLANDVQKQDAELWDFKNGFNKGDIMILIGKKPGEIKEGNVIVFRADSNTPIIHRVIKKWENLNSSHFQTKGDNNPDISKKIGEDDISEERLIGKAVFKIPYLGWIKILFSQIIG